MKQHAHRPESPARLIFETLAFLVVAAMVVLALSIDGIR